MKNIKFITIVAISTMFMSCNQNPKTAKKEKSETDTFKYLLEQFADLKIIRYQVPGFDELSLKQKELIYYLSQAALCGNEITWDQNYKYNLTVKHTLEAIVENYKGDRNSNDFKNFMVYAKRVWFSNGIHHHYSSDKIMPEISQEYFAGLVRDSKDGKFPLKEGEKTEDFIKRISRIIFDPAIGAKKVSLDPSKDLVLSSSVNFYENVTEKEAEDFYKEMKKEDEKEPVSYGLNSKLVKENGKIIEKKWKKDGMYGPAIEKIIYWLEKAKEVAESDQQKDVIQKLIVYYQTGDLKKFDDYNVAWVKDNSRVDFVNGFIEVYEDPLAMKATYESVVNFKNLEATERTTKISNNAQWFEDNSPVDPRFKKKSVKGVSAKVITVAQLGGECYPTTPIGINLPNADWIRKEYGSKSVTMDNITYAYDMAAKGNGFMEEFCYSPEEVKLSEKYGYLAGNLTTDLHECLGHGSGQLLPGVSTEAMKNYHSVLEESRADLFALYYVMDQKMIEIGVMPDLDVAKAEYSNYIRNGLMTQLVRIQPGKDIEQAHMRNRSLIAHWVYEKGKAENVIEKKIKDGKTYFVVNDYEKLRKLFGELLKEMQRIKSEGDYNAGKELVEKYAVKVDQALHKEVLERYKKLNLTPYGGFLNPVFKPEYKGDKLVDIKIEYPMDFTAQILYYSKNYSFLPVVN